jgi:hypothetical protein
VTLEIYLLLTQNHAMQMDPIASGNAGPAS